MTLAQPGAHLPGANAALGRHHSACFVHGAVCRHFFGGGIPIPHGSYKDFALAGLLALNLVTSTMGTTVGLSTDLHDGIIDRFRALPMWQAAVLVGRSFADLMTSCICALIVAVTGLAVGWRPDAGVYNWGLRPGALFRLLAVLDRRLRGP